MTWRPSRTLLNFVIDAIGLLLMLSMIYTGILIRFVLPPGSTGRHGGRGITLLGMDRHGWGDLHFWLAAALLALLLVHVALHWSWVCGLWKRWRHSTDGNAPGRTRTVAGAALLVGLALLVSGLLWCSAASVKQRFGPRLAVGRQSNVTECWRSPALAPDRVLDHAEARPTRLSQPEDDETIRGFMTLREAADAAGVPVDHIKSSLGLPAGTSEHERLGRLRRRFGFQMQEVRRAVTAYRRLRAGEG